MWKTLAVKLLLNKALDVAKPLAVKLVGKVMFRKAKEETEDKKDA